MAAFSRPGGYRCEFVDSVADDFVCKSCQHVARNSNLTSCCGETFCKDCIVQVLLEQKPCPGCREDNFNVFSNRRDQKKILALQVHCTMKDRGCEWTGKLEGLDAHLDVDTGDCQYIDVPCPDCHQQVQKRELPTHLADACPQRDYNCRYCGFSGTYEVVCNDHWPECEQYPVQCPNVCMVGVVERCTLDYHLQMCPLQEIECDFSHAGCTEKFLRQDLERHMEENTQKHLILVSAATTRISQEFEQKLEKKFQEQYLQIQGVIEKKEEEIAIVQEALLVKDQQITEMEQRFQRALEIKDQQLKALQEQLQQTQVEMKALEQKQQETDIQIWEQLQHKGKQIEDLQRQVEELTATTKTLGYGIHLHEAPIIVSNFTRLKSERRVWFSQPFNTHSGGYKCCAYVTASGWGIGVGTHVAVWLWKMRGDHDNQLPWPAKCTITLQLIDQVRDRDHITVTQHFEWSKPQSEKRAVGTFSDTFIAHADLAKPNPYLKNDCLQFRILKIE